MCVHVGRLCAYECAEHVLQPLCPKQYCIYASQKAVVCGTLYPSFRAATIPDYLCSGQNIGVGKVTSADEWVTC